MNLLNVLIVDDEPFIVDWLSNLLETQKELEIYIYRAYSAPKAMELIENSRIDLLISDIQMPVHNGFDIARQAARLWPNSKAILLTAYPDFNYAQKAIQQGVFSYILKTASDEEVLVEIKKAISAIDKNLNQLALINDIEKDLKNFQTQLKINTFSLWLNGYFSASDFTEKIKLLGYDPNVSDNFMLVICRIDAVSFTDSQTLYSTIKPFQIQRILEHYLNPHVIHSCFDVQNELLLGILQLPLNFQRDFQLIADTLDLAQAACKKTLSCSISCLVSPCGNANEIASFWSLGKMLLAQFSDETDFIFCYQRNSNTTDSTKERERLLKPSLYNQMRHALENGEQTTFMQFLTAICGYLSKNQNWHDNYSLQIYYSLALTLISYINQNHLSDQISFHASTGILFRPWLAESWETLEINLYQIANALFLLKHEDSHTHSMDIVQSVQSYVETHITEDISLQDLAVLTGYSTCYLSKRYSDSTGMTISSYIAEKKLEKITELMRNKDMSIAAITNTMGFHSRAYFNNFMKRVTGMSPQQYRDSL